MFSVRGLASPATLHVILSDGSRLLLESVKANGDIPAKKKLSHPVLGDLEVSCSLTRSSFLGLTPNLHYPALLFLLSAPFVLRGSIVVPTFQTTSATALYMLLVVYLFLSSPNLANFTDATLSLSLSSSSSAAATKVPTRRPDPNRSDASLVSSSSPAAPPADATLLYTVGDLFAGCLVSSSSSSSRDVDVAQLLSAADAFLGILRSLGRCMALACKACEGNSLKTTKFWNTDKDKYSTLRAMLEAEKLTGVHKPGGKTRDPSAAIGLLWMRRSIAFVVAIFEGITSEEELTFGAAATAGYKKELQQFHGMVLKSIFSGVLASVPTKESFANTIAPGVPEEQQMEVVKRDMRHFLVQVKPLFTVWKELFVELDLENMAVV